MMGNSQRKKEKVKVSQKENHESEIAEEFDENLEKLETNELQDDLAKKESERKVNLESAANYIQEYLEFAIGEVSKEEVAKKVSDFGKVVTFLEGEYILRSGEDSQGLFVILDGSVGVVVTDDTLTVASLSVGDIFGEMSVIFGVKCTANIKVTSDVTAVVIEPDKAFELFEEHVDSLDIIDWLVKNRYFPLGKEIDMTRTYRRMTLHFLKQVPAFASWEETYIKNMIMSIKGGLVTLYPSKATLISAGDNIHSLYVVIRGTVRVSSSGGFSKDIEVSRHTSPFIYGHFCMSIVTHKSSVTVQAITNCQVIEVGICTIYVAANRDGIPKLQDRPRTFAVFKKRLPHIKQEFPGYFEYDVLYHYLKISELYKDMSVIDIESKVLNSLCEECSDGGIVVLAVEREKYESVLVLNGTLILQQTVKPENDLGEVDKGNNDNEVTDSNTESSGDCKDEKKTLSNTNVKVVEFEEGSIVDISNLDFSQVSVKSKGQSFVSKIPKNPKDMYTVTINDDTKHEISKTEFPRLSHAEYMLNTRGWAKIGTMFNRPTPAIIKPVKDKDVEPNSENVNSFQSVEIGKQISEQNNENQESDKEKEQPDDKQVSKPILVEDSMVRTGDVQIKQSGDPLNKLNERIKKGDKIDKTIEKEDKKKVKKPKKTNELEFV